MNQRLQSTLELLSRAQAHVEDELAERDTQELRAAAEAIHAACDAVKAAAA